MKRFLCFCVAFLGLACRGPSVFSLVSLTTPEFSEPPAFDSFQVEVSAEIDGELIRKSVSFANPENRTLPLSFFLEFEDEHKGIPLELQIIGEKAGVEVFHASGEGFIGSELSLPALFCGDFVVQKEFDEICDDGNEEIGDGCRPDCSAEVCGDGILDAREECDDGNLVPDDGCDTDCTGPDVVQIAVGENHTCALLDTGDISCWGEGTLGYANRERIGDDEQPFVAGIIDIGGKAVQIAAGAGHSCALLDTGKVRCWGNDINGSLGHPEISESRIGDNEAPASVGDVNLGSEAVVQIVAGGEHTCALTESKRVRCWGKGPGGRLGYGNENNIGDNEAVVTPGFVNVGGNVIQLTAGGSHTCALLENKKIRCWGGSIFGQNEGELGYGNENNIGDDEVPSSAGDINIGGDAVEVTAGVAFTCVLLTTGEVRCWGRASSGSLGYGNKNNIGDNELPIVAGDVSLGFSANQISAGRTSFGQTTHVCATSIVGEVRCWGPDSSGSLGYQTEATDGIVGDDEVPSSLPPVDVGGTVIQIAAGRRHTCALLDTGKVRCWGDNFFGQLGYGNTENIGDDESPASAGDVNITGF